MKIKQISSAPGWIEMDDSNNYARQPHALIIATDKYNDPGLSRLRSPSKDAEQLTRVLKDPAIGGFSTNTLVNKPGHLILEEIEGFFEDRHPEDLLVLHMSCHGVKDLAGRLYFAAETTKLNRLAASGISADFVYEQVDRCRARKVLILLDCCYSGAYLNGRIPRSSEKADIGRLAGRGRAVITSSTALEYSFEIDTGKVTGAANPSVFTDAIVQGLHSGEADRDSDGLISVDDLYGYVYDRVREVTPHQTPEKKWGNISGDFIIAKNRNFSRKAQEPLPGALVEELRSTHSDVRDRALREVARLAFSSDEGVSAAARKAINALADEGTHISPSVVMTAVPGPGGDAGPQAKTKPRKALKHRKAILIGSICAIIISVAGIPITRASFSAILHPSSPGHSSPSASASRSDTSSSSSSSTLSALRRYRAKIFESNKKKERARSANSTPTPSGSSGTPATIYAIYEPWKTSSTGLAAGIDTIDNVNANCPGGSNVSTRSDAYRCFTKNSVYDPCFVSRYSLANHPPLACPEHGIVSVVMVRPTNRISSHASIYPETTWLVILSDNTVCYAADGAMGGPVGGLYTTYTCSDGSELYGRISKINNAWMIYQQSSEGSALVRVPIADAYS